MSAAARPPHERRTRRRAPTQWDVRPADYVEGSIAPTTATATPVGPAIAGMTAVSAPTQQTRHARRLYVGGLGEVPEREIAEFFADLVVKAALRPIQGNPILSVYLNPERKFAFVEFNSIELANAFVELSGIVFKGAPVKIKRPSDYEPAIVPLDVRDKKEPLNLAVIPMAAAPMDGGMGGGRGGAGGGMGGGMGGSASGGPSLHRIYIGNIPHALTEGQLGELASAFGPLKRLDFMKTPEGAPRGYAFIEYADAAITDAAIAGLDGLPVGDRTLTASRAKNQPGGAGPTPGAAATGGAGVGGGMGAGRGGLGATGSNAIPLGYPPSGAGAASGGMPMPPALPMAPLYGGAPGGGGGGYAPAGGHVGPMGAASATSATAPAAAGYGGPAGSPTRVVVLDQMVLPEELLSDADYRDIVADIRTECSKYGALLDVQVPRPPRPGNGRVFLHYADVDAAVTAATSLSGRQFASRNIRAAFYDEGAFRTGFFEG